MLLWWGGALAAAVLLDRVPARIPRGGAGLLLAGLGVLSLATGAGTLDPGRLGRTAATAAVPPWFLEVNVALLVAGALVAAWASRTWTVAAVGAVLPALLLPLGPALPVPRVAVLALATLGLVALLTRMAHAVPPVRDHRGRPGEERSRYPWPVLVAGLAAAASPNLHLALGAAIAAFGLAVRAADLRRDRLVLLIGTAAVALASVLALHELWPTAGWLAALADAPVSTPAAVRVAGLLLAAAAIAMLWLPFRRGDAGVALAPTGFVLAGQVAPQVFPLGAAWWLPAAYPVALTVALASTLTGRGTAARSALALAGAGLGTPGARLGAGALLAAALGEALLRRFGSPTATAWRRGGHVATVIGGGLVLRAGLGAEVVYTVAGCLLLAAALLGRRPVAALREPA